MNKKGFTLVELLAVVIILALLATLASTSVINIVKDSKSDLYDAQIELIKVAAETWGAENLDLLPESGECTYITLNQLQEYGLLDKNIKNPKTNELFDKQMKIKITSETTAYNSLNIEYEVDSNDITGCAVPNYFATDSWETIIKNVKEGNINQYNVGDEKEITLTGFGTYTVRIANKSTPAECITSGFSQTACGFVIEFVDIITKHVMNSTYTNVGGWRDSEMRSYVNNQIYNSLPTVLKNNIINTTVVSGHGNSDTSNFTTTDKLYLLESKELYGTVTNYSTIESETRQLDYYKNIGAETIYNTGGAIKKYNGLKDYWWLRSAHDINSNTFSYVLNDGAGYGVHGTVNAIGVAPAFRLEKGTNKLCKLESGTSKTTSAQYTCTLDEDRTFYVLGENASDSNKIDLIMDRNYVDDTVPTTMAWCASGSNGSENTCNHDGLDPYIAHIQEVFGDSVTVSLPTGQQIATAGGDTAWTSDGYVTDYKLPLWLWDNLYSDTNTSLAKAYWTSTPSNSIDAWYVSNSGSSYKGITYDDSFVNYGYGLRPVITISKSGMN